VETETEKKELQGTPDTFIINKDRVPESLDVTNNMIYRICFFANNFTW